MDEITEWAKIGCNFIDDDEMRSGSGGDGVGGVGVSMILSCIRKYNRVTFTQISPLDSCSLIAPFAYGGNGKEIA